MAEPIDPMLAGKLDAFTVPPLPAAFTDRLVAAALAEGPVAAPCALPPLRRPPGARRWLRGGAAGLGAVAIGMISISAAAMGYFGEPIRHAVQTAPVIGKVIERVLPRKARPANHSAPIRPAPAAAAKAAVAAPTAEPTASEALPAAPLSRAERRQRVRAIMADPAARKAWIEAHPVAAQRIARRRAAIERRRAAAGLSPRLAPQADGLPHGPERPMLRRGGLSPEQRLELRQRLRERRLRRMEQRGDWPPAEPPQP